MFNHELYATSFGRAVDLFRDRTATRDHQKSALRALVALSGLSSATLRVYDGGLSVDDVSIPPTLPHITSLVERLELHRVQELMLAKEAEPRELLALLKALAAEPGGKSVKEYLRDSESKRIMVILSDAPEPGTRRRPMSVTQAFVVSDLDELAAERAREQEGAKAQRQVDMVDDAMSRWDEMATAGSAGSAMPEIDLGFAVEPQPAQTPAAEPEAEAAEPAAPAATRPSLSTRTPLEAAVTDLGAEPYGGNILDRLTHLSELIQEALREDRVDEVLAALSAVVGLEPGAPEGTPRNSYGIVLKRTLTRETLTQLSSHALDPLLTEQVAVILRRGRGEAAEVLLGLLAVAEGKRERRTYMQILRTMPQGVEQAIHMLSHHQWFVARNVADLMGDVRLEESVPELGSLLSHGDHRVRRAAAVALAKIGTPATVEPLRRALKEADAELKMLVATSVGQASRALAMPLVTMISAETNADVVREYTVALGRIGSPEAVQALVQAAEPGGRLVGRKPTSQRLAAVEGLKLAGAKRPLEVLSGDGDKQVSEAARVALEELAKSE